MLNPGDDRNDPPWFTPKSLLYALVPQLAIRRLQQRFEVSPLMILRQTFLSFVIALVMFGVVLAFMAPGLADADISAGASAAAVAVWGAISLVLPRVLERPMDCSTDEALAGSFRTRYFLRVAFAESAALVGFIAVFLAGEYWMYPLGATFAAVGFVRLAPTSGHVQKEQEALNLQGCGRSLHSALTTPASGPSN